MLRAPGRRGFSLIELLVVVAILAILVALLMAAVQKARDGANRVYCANNLKEIGVALNNYQSVVGTYPPGMTPPWNLQVPRGIYPYGALSWLGLILPYIDQQNGWRTTQAAFAANPIPNINPPHVMQSHVIHLYTCPGDPRVLQAHDVQGYEVALTSYLGVNGTNLRTHDGILFSMSKVRAIDVTDGLSNTLLVGERPPSVDLWGWWYAGSGQYDTSQGMGLNTGSGDGNLGAAELNIKSAPYGTSNSCPSGPYAYGSGSLEQECDMFHFWSLHSYGCNFAFADGSVRFVTYSIGQQTFQALATRAGGEKVVAPD